VGIRGGRGHPECSGADVGWGHCLWNDGWPALRAQIEWRHALGVHRHRRVSRVAGDWAEETIHIGSTSGRVYALYSGGTLRWSWIAGGRISSTPALAPGGAIYVASEDRLLTALSAEGVPLWAYRADDGFEASPVIAPDGTVYAASRDGRLHAVNPDGTAKWVIRLYQIPEASAALGAGGVVYLGEATRSFGRWVPTARNSGNWRQTGR